MAIKLSFRYKIVLKVYFNQKCKYSIAHIICSGKRTSSPNELPRKIATGQNTKRVYFTGTEVTFKLCLLIDLVNCKQTIKRWHKTAT